MHRIAGRHTTGRGLTRAEEKPQEEEVGRDEDVNADEELPRPDPGPHAEALALLVGGLHLQRYSASQIAGKSGNLQRNRLRLSSRMAEERSSQ